MGSKNLELCVEIVKYLDYTGHFNELLDSIKSFLKKTESGQEIHPIFYIKIAIDLTLLANISGNVANIVLREPLIAQELFRKIIQLTLKTEKNPIHNLVDIQLHILTPSIPFILAFTDESYFPSNGLFVIKGVLAAHTLPTKYCKSAVFRCPLESCSGREGHRVLFSFNGKVSTGVCKVCGCKQEEYLRARVNGDQVLGIFNQREGFQLNFKRYEGITVCLKDQLTNNLCLGSCYDVVSSIIQSTVYGWGIRETISENQRLFDKDVSYKGIPSDILKLEKHVQITCPNSPWALTASLSSQLASDLYPVNSFFHLKIGILLSLASQNVDKVPVPLLAVGPECYSLLQVSSQLSQSRVAVTSTTLSGPVGGSAGPLWLEAGPLQLASGGVCYLGDWAKFSSGRNSSATQIITALETSRVDMVVPNNSTLGSPPSQPLRAAVWSFWSGDKATAAAQTQLRTLIDVFGLPFIGDGSGDIEAVAQHLLIEAMEFGKNRAECISQDSIKKYLDIICSYKVQLTSEASRLLRNYFVASRRERPDCLPLSAIKTM